MKDVKSVALDGVSYDAENVASKEKDVFVKEMMAGKNYKGYDAADRKKLFEKAFSLCKDAVKPREEKPLK